MSTAELPFLTPTELAIGGRIKAACEDFVVEEIPAYEPSGEGEHVYLWIEKTDRSAEQLIAWLARVLCIRREEVGLAGLKDRFAITRQWASVPARVARNVSALQDDAMKVLQQSRHRNKLHVGHSKGNRFDILVRDVASDSLAIAGRIAESVLKTGVPNYFGDQRFGVAEETLNLGLGLLRGERTTDDIVPARRKFLSRLAISAAQSAIFNEVLARRIEAGTLLTVRTGDVMQVRASGGCFVVEDVVREQARFEAGEISPTGPLFGPKLLHPRAVARQEELGALRVFGLDEEAFSPFGRMTPGARRALLCWPRDLEFQDDPLGLRMRMTLGPGVYATTVLREFMKNTPTGATAPTQGDT